MNEVVRKYYVDEGEKTITFVNVQDVEPILDLNKEERSQDQNSDFARKIGRIPNALMLQWFYEEVNRGNTAFACIARSSTGSCGRNCKILTMRI
jgi:hypothetical protein